MTVFLMILFILVCILLIGVILLQKGRGGGLSGAFGGVGGHSAFGTRTGDMFTWITVVLVGLFLLLGVVTVKHFRPDAAVQAQADPGLEATPLPGQAETPDQAEPVDQADQEGLPPEAPEAPEAPVDQAETPAEPTETPAEQPVP